MFSLFKKEPKTQCDYSYEYSYITYGDVSQPRSNNDSGMVDSFCYFEWKESKYFIIGDHSGKILLFDYFTGVELKNVIIKSKAKGMLRVKKMMLFLREVIEEKKIELEKMKKERIRNGIINIEGKNEEMTTYQMIKDDNIIENYDGQCEDNEEETNMKNEINELNDILNELENKMKNVNKDNEEKIFEFTEECIERIETKYNLNCERNMISSGNIGDIQFCKGIICIAFRKEIFKIELEAFMELKDNELIIDEGKYVTHDGIIKKIYVKNDKFISIGNDKKIAFWNLYEEKACYVMERESDDYYKTSLLTEKGDLYIARTNEIYVYHIDCIIISNSKFVQKLQKDGNSPHVDDVDLIETINSNKLLTASCDGIVSIWDLHSFSLLQTMNLNVQVSEQKKSLFNLNSLIFFEKENYSTYYFAYGGWIVEMVERNNVLTDVSPKRNDEVFGLPFGRYSVDVTQLIKVSNNIVLAVTGESATFHVLENVKDKKHDTLKFVESRKLNGKINKLFVLDEEDNSFIITLHDGTILMLKDSLKEMKRRRTLFMNEMQGF